MLKVPRQIALIFLSSVLIFSIGCSLEKADSATENRVDTTYKKGLNWMQKHPQKIEDNLSLYVNELNFYYLLTEKSKTEKEREFFRGIFIQRLRQSDGFNFKKPASPLDNCYYALILGFRRWSGIYEESGNKTNSALLSIVNEDIMENINSYTTSHPLELIFIDYISRKFDLGLAGYTRPVFKWWEFLGVMDEGGYKPTSSTKLNNYDFFVGYHVTHVVLIDSDYGLRHLNQESYEREYQYIIGNMDRFISNKYIDIVSEFIICLKILRATNTPVYEKAMDYMISSQSDDGSWDDNYASREHTTMASLIALRQD